MLTKLNHKYRCTVGAVDIKKSNRKKTEKRRKKVVNMTRAPIDVKYQQISIQTKISRAFATDKRVRTSEH